MYPPLYVFEFEGIEPGTSFKVLEFGVNLGVEILLHAIPNASKHKHLSAMMQDVSLAVWNVHVWVMTIPHDRLDCCKPFFFQQSSRLSHFWCTSEIPPASWRLIRIGSGGGPPSLKVNRVGSKAGLLVTVPLWIFSTQLISRKNAPSYRLPHNTECQRQCCLQFCETILLLSHLYSRDVGVLPISRGSAKIMPPVVSWPFVNRGVL